MKKIIIAVALVCTSGILASQTKENKSKKVEQLTLPTVSVSDRKELASAD